MSVSECVRLSRSWNVFATLRRRLDLRLVTSDHAHKTTAHFTRFRSGTACDRTPIPLSERVRRAERTGAPS